MHTQYCSVLVPSPIRKLENQMYVTYFTHSFISHTGQTKCNAKSHGNSSEKLPHCVSVAIFCSYIVVQFVCCLQHYFQICLHIQILDCCMSSQSQYICFHSMIMRVHVCTVYQFQFQRTLKSIMIVQHTVEPLLKDISEIWAPHQDNYFSPNGVRIRGIPLYNIFSCQEHYCAL